MIPRLAHVPKPSGPSSRGKVGGFVSVTAESRSPLWYQENEVVNSVIRHKSGARRAEGNLIGSYRLTAE